MYYQEIWVFSGNPKMSLQLGVRNKLKEGLTVRLLSPSVISALPSPHLVSLQTGFPCFSSFCGGNHGNWEASGFIQHKNLHQLSMENIPQHKNSQFSNPGLATWSPWTNQLRLDGRGHIRRTGLLGAQPRG